MGEYLDLLVEETNAYLPSTSSVTDSADGDVYFGSIADSDIPEPLR